MLHRLAAMQDEPNVVDHNVRRALVASFARPR